MKLSVVIPVFNEISTIEKIVKAIKTVDINKEIVIVDDYSTDGTRQKLSELADDTTRIYYHERNMGKGAALRTGFSKVTGDIVLIQDADLEYDPQQYPKLLQPILDGKADVVYGSRFVTGDYRRVLYYWHMVGNALLTTISNMLTNLNLTDIETCYKVFRKEVLQMISIEENRFGIEPEITAKISKLNLRIYEVGISYSGRTYKEGKKVSWKDGISAIRCIIKYNLFG